MYPATGTITGGGILALFVYPKSPAPAGGYSGDRRQFEHRGDAGGHRHRAGRSYVPANQPDGQTGGLGHHRRADGLGGRHEQYPPTKVLPPAPSHVALYPAAHVPLQSDQQEPDLSDRTDGRPTTVTVTISNPAALKVSNSSVPAGATWGSFSMITGVVAASTAVPIWVTTGGVTYTVVATVIP